MWEEGGEREDVYGGMEGEHEKNVKEERREGTGGRGEGVKGPGAIIFVISHNFAAHSFCCLLGLK